MSAADSSSGLFDLSSLALRKAFLWVAVLVTLTTVFFSLLTIPNTIDPMRFKYLTQAAVIRVEPIDNDVLNPARKILFRLADGSIQWGLGIGYRSGDQAQVLVYQRLMTRRVEYRLLEPVTDKALKI